LRSRDNGTVLAQAIAKEGANAVAAGMKPMDLKRGHRSRS
jgi:chaperonin GroEL (HSP60 family)